MSEANLREVLLVRMSYFQSLFTGFIQSFNSSKQISLFLRVVGACSTSKRHQHTFASTRFASTITHHGIAGCRGALLGVVTRGAGVGGLGSPARPRFAARSVAARRGDAWMARRGAPGTFHRRGGELAGPAARGAARDPLEPLQGWRAAVATGGSV